MSGVGEDLHLIWKRGKDGVRRAAHVGFIASIKKSEIRKGVWIFCVEEDNDDEFGLECSGSTHKPQKAKEMVEYFMFHNMKLGDWD